MYINAFAHSQHIEVHEDRIRYCNEICQSCENMHKYCEKEEVKYIKAFNAEVIRSDR